MHGRVQPLQAEASEHDMNDFIQVNAACSWYLPAVFIQCLIFVAENAEGKYISPFHDIPMYADEGQVSHLYPVAYVNMRAFIRSALKINFPCSTGSDVQLLFFFSVVVSQ